MSPYDPSLINFRDSPTVESFHDAEIDRLELRTGMSEGSEPYLLIEVRPLVRLRQEDGALTIRFDDVREVDLDGFGDQNVLFDLHLERVTSADGKAGVAVTMSSSFNLGGYFECSSATVIASAVG